MRSKWALAFLLLATCIPVSLYPQGGSLGTIVGFIQDSSRAAVPGAQITVRNLATNITRSVTTDTSGNYTIPNLLPGAYELKAVKQGFETAVAPDVQLDVNAAFRVDFTLRVGRVAQTVEVSSAPPMLQTDSAAVGDVIEQDRVVELPLNGRVYQQLELLSPGSVNVWNNQTQAGMAAGASTAATTSNPVVVVSNGTRAVQTLYLVDGANTSDQLSRYEAVSPNPDEISEFKVQGSNYSAQFGFGTNVVNVATRSGTNHLHGTAWEFLRNNDVDSRNFFSPNTEPLKRNQFGASAGGPIYLGKLYNGKDKAFWFFDWEQQIERDGFVSVATVPTAAMRSGDLSTIGSQIYDPATSVASSTSPSGFMVQPFAGNIIPPGRINATDAFFMNTFIPLPNSAGLVNNYVINPSTKNDYNHWSPRLDFRINDSNALMVRYMLQRNYFPYAVGPYGPKVHPPYDPGTMPQHMQGEVGIVRWDHTFSPTAVLETVVSSWKGSGPIDNSGIVKGGTNFDIQQGIAGFGPTVSALYPTFPLLSVSGYTGLPGGGFGVVTVDYSWDEAVNLTLIRGKHTLTIGGTHRRYGSGGTVFGEDAGDFEFTGNYTQNPNAGPNSPPTGAGLADDLLGIPFSGGRYIPPGWFYQHVRNVWSYVADDWKVTPKLTLNLGLRYEVNFPTVANNNIQDSFWPAGRNGQGAIVVSNTNVINPVTNPSGMTAIPLDISTFLPEIVTAAQAHLPMRSLRFTNFHEFAPRFGFAYRATPNTVIRGAFGIFFVPIDANRESEWLSVPSLVRESGRLNVVDSNDVPQNTINTFFPAQSSFSAVTSLLAHDPNGDDFGYSQQWNFTVERSLPGSLVLDVGYVGNSALKLQDDRELNSPMPGPGAIQPRRPFPDFTTIAWDEQDGFSRYESLQVKLERRFSAGLTFSAAYTRSKLLDLDSEGNTEGHDPFHLTLDYGPAEYDSPNIFSGSFVYQHPFFKNRSDPVSRFLRGWELTSIVQAHTGYPFTPLWSGDPTNTGGPANTGGNTFPDRICNGALSNPNVNDWFNLNCFVLPVGYSYGTSGRNILRGPNFFQWDAGLFRDFGLGEHRQLQFRSEYFNLFNNVNFSQPATTVNAVGAGVISSAAPARIIQFALKLSF